MRYKSLTSHLVVSCAMHIANLIFSNDMCDHATASDQRYHIPLQPLNATN